MFFILSKALFFLLSPMNWILFLLFGFLFFKKEKWKKRSKYALLFVLFFFTNTVIFLTFCGWWEIKGTPLHQVKHHEIGIVLGGMAEYNNDLKTLSLRRGGDRIWQAITLYKAKKIKKIFISGDSGYVTDRGLKEAKQMKEILVKWGIPSEDIWTEEHSKNTYENAIETAKILRKKGKIKQSHLLITSGTHMRRALACFDKAKVKCDTYSTDLYTGPKSQFYWDQYFMPEADNLSDWQKLIKEWVGYFIYDITGKI